MKYHLNPIVLKLKDLKVHLGTCNVLDSGNITIHKGERIGLIGHNGSGKTSLLKVITGQEEYDGGSIEISDDIIIGYLSQNAELDDTKNVYTNIKSGASHVTELIDKFENLDPKSPERIEIENQINQYDGWNLGKRIDEIIQELNIPAKEKSISNLSGGEKRRISLAKSLILQPDLLILDEPTNHLDTVSIVWLENFLKNYPGTVIMVTHDRYFLDKTTTRIVELFRGDLFFHNGNYSDYLKDKEKRMIVAKQQDSKRKSFLKKEYEWVIKNPSARSTKDKGRLERYYKLKEKEDFNEEKETQILLPPAQEFSNRILNLTNIEFKFTDKVLFQDFDFSFNKNQKVGIVGPNGVGKTTLLKIITEEISPTSGTIKKGNKTKFNYYDQNKVALDEEKTVFEEIGNGKDTIQFGDSSISLRGYLKRFLFVDDSIDKKIKSLSGGEKSRLLLAKILKKGGNFIILDEPTNDLDFPTLKILEDTLINFEGCTIIVSHDRYFLNKVCTEIWAMEGNGKIKRYMGNYDDYIQKKSKIENKSEKKNSEIDKLTSAEKDELRKIEKKIKNAENKVLTIEQKFNDPDLYNKEKKFIDKITKELEKSKERVEALYRRWEELESRNI